MSPDTVPKSNATGWGDAAKEKSVMKRNIAIPESFDFESMLP